MAFRILELLIKVFSPWWILRNKKNSLCYNRHVLNFTGRGVNSVTGKIEASDKVNQGDASAESQSSDRIPLFSKVLLRGESGAAASNPSTRFGQQLMSRGLHMCRWATIWLRPAKLGRGIQTYSYESNRVFLYIDDANDNRLKYFNWNYLLHSKGSCNYQYNVLIIKSIISKPA